MPIHVSNHPSLKAKLCRLRSGEVTASGVRKLAKEITSILAVEVSKQVFAAEEDSSTSLRSLAGGDYAPVLTSPTEYVIVPILRSGLAMLESFQDLLPNPDAPAFLLGLFRDKASLSPVEYYNKLPRSGEGYELAVVVDPVIATGGTSDAVIQTLKEWKVKKIVFCAILGSEKGLDHVASAHPDVEFYIGHVDSDLSASGYILPGIGDIGDRLYSTHADYV
ncbi:uracil phosphoribosyltransferase [Trichomonascus vanleenenianus]|uniref:uracil phosphoribosyltransferase n=1 Tax=Trichomonascus vanleenenianus TaxID=2268995 RepID=UPI003ECB0913